ncbi:MAG TPA: hypothetical protein P5084_04015 [Paludibacter sp.]|nr:hypothetical protein [Paludibacter sp.]
MKKILLIFVLFGQLIFAQQVGFLSVKTIEKLNGNGFYHPVFSPTSDFLIVTNMNFEGLKMISLKTNEVKTITEEKGAGYGVRISDDGNSVLFRKTELIKNLKYSSLHLLTLNNNSQKQLISRTRDNFTSSFSANKPYFVKGVKLNRKSVPQSELKPVIQIEDRKMILYKGSNRTKLTPNGENASYIWPSVSPDQTKIVYTVASKGTWVCDINGSNVRSLGKLSAPKWLNNNTIIGMDDKDNNKEVISSTIVAVSSDGTMRQTLTNEFEVKAMYPTASVDGKKIAFCTDNGDLYLLNIENK